MDVGRLFEAHHEALYRYLYRLTGDPELAADAVQEAFTRMIARRPRDENPRAWLYRVATNAALESGRTASNRARLLAASPHGAALGDDPTTPDTAVEVRERRERVQRALASLSPRERTILLMREEGFKHREIAEAVGTTTGSIGTMIARALEKLAEALDLDRELVP